MSDSFHGLIRALAQATLDYYEEQSNLLEKVKEDVYGYAPKEKP